MLRGADNITAAPAIINREPPSDIQIEFQAPLAWVTLNRPDKRNAVTAQMWAALARPRRAGGGGRFDPRVALIPRRQPRGLQRGCGHRRDDARRSGHRSGCARCSRRCSRASWPGRRLAIPTIAAIRGACTGGGCGLALACDLRLAGDDSFRGPPARLGHSPALDDTRRLVDLVGPRAKEILFTGRRIGAREALDLRAGQPSRARRRARGAALELAGTIANNAGNSIAAAKHVVNLIMDSTRAETAATRADGVQLAGIRRGARCAAVEKRTPRFR
ncbi:MAG: enoyl-CoA hydratase-related protein [Steroidobacteraceae bacterium]